jgi:hypothetical protein
LPVIKSTRPSPFTFARTDVWDCDHVLSIGRDTQFPSACCSIQKMPFRGGLSHRGTRCILDQIAEFRPYHQRLESERFHFSDRMRLAWRDG